MSIQLTHKLRNPKDLSQWLDIWTADVTEKKDENDNIVENEYVYTINPSSNWKIPITNLNFNNEGSSTSFLNEKGEWVSAGYNLILTKEKLFEDDENDVIKLVLNQNDNKINGIAILTDSLNITSELWGKVIKHPNGQTTILPSHSILNINAPLNTKDINGIVSAPTNANTSTVWATDDDGNPGWRKISNQLNTELLGVFISSETPEDGLTSNSWDYNHCGIWIET